MASPGGGAARKKSARRPGAGVAERTAEQSSPQAEAVAAAKDGRSPAEGEKRLVRKAVRPGPTSTRPAAGFKDRWEQFLRFLKSVKAEMKRVSWPGPKEVKAATLVVVVTLLIISGYMWIVDKVLTRLFGTPVVSGY